MTRNNVDDDFSPAVHDSGHHRTSRFLSFLTLMGFLFCAMFAPGPTWATEMVRVKVNKANLRSGPGTRYEKVWQVPKNYPYRVLGRKGRWLRVRDFEGFEDWIYGPLTDRKPAAIVKIRRANVRQGPGTKHPIVFTADIGVAFQLLAKKGSWVKVRASDGDQGWIHKNLIWGFFESGERDAKKNSN